MAKRKLLTAKKREYISVSVSTDADRDLLHMLRQRAQLMGVSMRRLVLDVLTDYMRGQ